MGESLMIWYDQRVKKEWKLAFLSTFVTGLLVHMFRFTNVLPNHDALFNQYNSQNMVGSGRWFLTIACGISGYFDLPWLIGILSIFYIALTAVVIVEIFEMENRIQVILTSGILVSFPAVTETMYFEFAADGYMLAMLFSSLSVLITKVDFLYKKAHKWSRFAVAAMLLCLSCAIYQAYLSFALILLICYAIIEILKKQYTPKELWKWVGVQILTYMIALMVYYVIWKLCLNVQKYEATSFRGIDTIGKITFQNIKTGIYTSVVTPIVFFTEHMFRKGMTLYAGLNSLFIVFAVCGGLFAVARSGVHKSRGLIMLLILALMLLPFVACIWSFVSVDAFYSVRMLMSFSVLYIFALDVFVRWISPKKAELFAMVMALIICCNSVSANSFYMGMHRCFERSYASMVELNTRIHMLDDGTIRYIAIVGEADDYEEYTDYLKEQYRNIGILEVPEYSVVRNRARIPIFLATFTDFSLSYYLDNGLQYPQLDFETNEIPAPHDWCVRFPLVAPDQRDSLQKLPEVRNMANWPAAGSVKVVGDVIVVKIGNI